MSDMPERIWAGRSAGVGGWHEGVDFVNHTPYVREDAPLTPAEAMRCPEVAAIVKAAYIASGHVNGRAFDLLDAALAPFTKS